MFFVGEIGKREAKEGPVPGSSPGGSEQAGIHGEAETKLERVIVCAACGQAITWERARASVNGSHVHTFKNPSGIDYVMGCFSEVDGCREIGERSGVWTWFPGFAWCVVECAKCGAHLGWSFTGGSTFWGLILERLV